MALKCVESAEQVQVVARLLGLAAIRLKRMKVAKSLGSSPEIGDSALEISAPSVITVSRGNGLATGETGCSDDLQSDGDALERTTTRRNRDHSGASDSAKAGQANGEGRQAEISLEAKRFGGER